LQRIEKIKEITNFKASKLIFSSNNLYFLYNSANTIHFRDLSNFEVITKIKLSQKIDDFTLTLDESLIITTAGYLSTMFSNPLKCEQVSLFGD
jgi:hypothetical protein